MSEPVKYIAEGFHTVTPYLHVDGAAAAIAFYNMAFGATEIYHLDGPNGTIAHAEIQFGDSRIMLADESEQMKAFGPNHYGGASTNFMVYVEDVDAVVQQALDAGATLTRPVADQFYGDRTGGVVDPFGHHWYLATHIRDVSPEEMSQAMQAMAGASA